MTSSPSPATGDSSAPVRQTLSDMRNFLEQMHEYGHGLDEWHLTREAMERVLKLAIKAEEAAIVMRLSDLSKRCAPSETGDIFTRWDAALERAAQICEGRAAEWDSSVREGSEQRAYEETVLLQCAAAIRGLKGSTPSAIRQNPVDPESEDANPVWDLVIHTCAQAWPAGKLAWNNSPTELIVDIINERDEALAEVERLKHKILTMPNFGSE